MHRPPVVAAVRPGICAGPDRQELVVSTLVGDRPPAAAEVRIERREVGVLHVAVASACISLPYLDQRVGHRAARLVQHPAMHQDAFADSGGCALGPVQDQVVVKRAKLRMAEHRARLFRRRAFHGQKRKVGRA